MSHLARELDRQLVWIEKQAKDLALAVDDLLRAGDALMNGVDGWDDAQADTIRAAISDWGDNCGRSITHAKMEIVEFQHQLIGGGG